MKMLSNIVFYFGLIFFSTALMRGDTGEVLLIKTYIFFVAMVLTAALKIFVFIQVYLRIRKRERDIEEVLKSNKEFIALAKQFNQNNIEDPK
jgi:hypothetical protein